MATKPTQIPATTVAGPPTLAGASADGPLIDVPLADHTVVHLTLVPEPTAATGWLVTSIKH
ncbi:twin-arginine translocation pathway signal sequence domain protein [Cutibacterium acnes]|nr:twin-arginine translocation pathway signal sequence domain protein [Cutibacterium acnes]